MREGIEMAVGWTRDEGVQDQIDASVNEMVELARSRLPGGESLSHCETCKAPIPVERRKAMPGIRRCVRCQVATERTQ